MGEYKEQLKMYAESIKRIINLNTSELLFVEEHIIFLEKQKLHLRNTIKASNEILESTLSEIDDI